MSVRSNWEDDELDICVRAYMWMLDAQNAGYTAIKKTVVDKALRAGPLSARGKLDYRFANIASRINHKGYGILLGFKPQHNVGAVVASKLDGFIDTYINGPRHKRRLDCLVEAIPLKFFAQAGEMLASGNDYDFPDSTTYDAFVAGERIPPKKLTSYASLLYYGIPLFSDNFVGAKTGTAFRKISEAGIPIINKHDLADDEVDADEFRARVTKAKNLKADKPEGNRSPQKKVTISTGFDRDPYIVAAAEMRANGICELCEQPAPFNRPDGSPFLEVHHIIYLSDGGADTLDNVAALCPNCHRACHHGADKESMRDSLLGKF